MLISKSHLIYLYNLLQETFYLCNNLLEYKTRIDNLIFKIIYLPIWYIVRDS